MEDFPNHHRTSRQPDCMPNFEVHGLNQLLSEIYSELENQHCVSLKIQLTVGDVEQRIVDVRVGKPSDKLQDQIFTKLDVVLIIVGCAANLLR